MDWRFLPVYEAISTFYIEPFHCTRYFGRYKEEKEQKVTKFTDFHRETKTGQQVEILLSKSSWRPAPDTTTSTPIFSKNT